MDELSEIRQAIEALGKRGPRPRYPKELRERIVSYAQAELQRGHNVEEIAAELGMKWRTLQRWRSEHKQGQFRRVQVVPNAPASKTLTLYGPLGVRLEGLALDEVAELIRRLA